MRHFEAILWLGFFCLCVFSRINWKWSIKIESNFLELKLVGKLKMVDFSAKMAISAFICSFQFFPCLLIGCERDSSEKGEDNEGKGTTGAAEWLRRPKIHWAQFLDGSKNQKSIESLQKSIEWLRKRCSSSNPANSSTSSVPNLQRVNHKVAWFRTSYNLLQLSTNCVLCVC